MITFLHHDQLLKGPGDCTIVWLGPQMQPGSEFEVRTVSGNNVKINRYLLLDTDAETPCDYPENEPHAKARLVHQTLELLAV